MRITAIAITNFKRIKDVAITPGADRTIILLGGKNRQGKSSTLDALTAAFGGKKTLPSDPGAKYDVEVTLNAADIVPQVTWGTSPEDVLPITAKVPDPDAVGDEGKRKAMQRSIDYMGLTPGRPIAGTPIDRVFIGSCTNSRIEDLRAVAAVVEGHRVADDVRAMVVPGSGLVKRAAEAEGIDAVLRAAGFDWREPGCSMCVGMNPDRLQPGERCAATSNRNFENRQGRGGRTHLMSPALAAASAIAGCIADPASLG